jgi:3-phosphoshikimate 1-carboxyvinyltransferase
MGILRLMPTPPAVSGVHQVPGDKSITHRALLLAALAPGRSTLRGALTSLDARSTARVLRQLGAEVSPLRPDGAVEIRGRGQLIAASRTLNCGNSGTTARLLIGILAAHSFRARVSGDASLRRRPMRRITEPLQVMGATVDAGPGDGLPLWITGGRLRSLSWTLPVASAQVKSALLLAGALGGVSVDLTEPGISRDHTERLLSHFGFEIHRREHQLCLEPTGLFRPFAMQVPGDPSSAAFLVAAALLARQGELRIRGVGLNPTRTGFLAILARMGAQVDVIAGAASLGEPCGDLVTRPASLKATTVLPAEVPGVIDEIPVLAVLAARAEGITRFHGLGELRVKESDRLNLLATNLAAIGARAEVSGDDLLVEGSDRPLGGRIVTHGDHRIAMAFMVLGSQPGADIEVDDPGCASVSFPRFAEKLAALFRGGR